MAKKLTEAQLQELNHKYEWTITILNFMDSQYPNGSIPMYIEVTHKAFDSQNLRGLRYVYNDVNEWASLGFRPDELIKLNGLLKEKFGFDFSLVNKKDIRKVKRILKRGTIANGDEYGILLSRADVIYDNKDYLDELNAINELLSKHSDTVFLD